MALEASPPRMQSSLKIVIVDENPIRAAILEDGLREAGHVHVVRLDETRICSRASTRSIPTSS